MIFSLGLLVFFLACFSIAHAQSDEKRFEVGGQFSTLSTQTGVVSGLTLTEDKTYVFGFGGRFGYNFSKYFALEAEVNFFPQAGDLEGGQKTQGLFGVKAGKRFDTIGLFAKARPGFIRFEKGDYRFRTGGGCPTVFPPPLGCFEPVAKTNFAFDVGGVVELYPSTRTIIRFDVGDSIVRFGSRLVAARSDVLTGLVAFPEGAETRHNFQGGVGFGFRF
jgi:hypothetical protein